MPLYYFNSYNDDEATLGEEGVILADDHAARAYTVAAVREMAAESALHGYFVGHHRVDYLDSNRHVIGKVRYDQAVRLS